MQCACLHEKNEPNSSFLGQPYHEAELHGGQEGVYRTFRDLKSPETAGSIFSKHAQITLHLHVSTLSIIKMGVSSDTGELLVNLISYLSRHQRL